MRKISPASTPKAGRQQPGSPSATVAVSARWLASAIAAVFLLAAVCVWATLCLTFWQGSWQLLYRPAATVARTPAATGVAFDQIAFASTETGVPRLRGWWCPAERANAYTAIYLHGAEGNLGDAIDSIRRLHAVGFAVLAFDYRGYGQSQFAHPSEELWKQDAESAFDYLTRTRHLAANSVVFAGDGLGADLALEMGAVHPEIAGIVVASPASDPTHAIFDDPRAHLLPAHWLVGDRWDLESAANALKVPSLWFCPGRTCSDGKSQVARAFAAVSSSKTIVPLDPATGERRGTEDALLGWTALLARGR